MGWIDLHRGGVRWSLTIEDLDNYKMWKPGFAFISLTYI